MKSFLTGLLYAFTMSNSVAAEGFVTVEKINDRWFFVDSEGKPFIQKGTVHNRSALDEWGPSGMGLSMEELETDLVRMGFNSHGYDMSGQTNYDIKRVPQNLMYLHWHYWFSLTEWSNYKSKTRFDVWDQAEKDNMAARIKIITDANKDNPNLIGYMFTDVPDYNTSWVTWIKNLGSNEPGRQAYDSWKADSPDGTDNDFLLVLLDELYKTASEIYRDQDPNHLLIGDNYGEWIQNQIPMMEVAAKYVDVISIQPNWTPGMRLDDYWNKVYEAVNKPILISDFKIPFHVEGKRDDFYGDDNRTQDESGQLLAEFFDQFLSTEYMVGWSHCEYVTEYGTKLGLYNDDKPDFTPYLDYQKHVIASNEAIDDYVAAKTDGEIPIAVRKNLKPVEFLPGDMQAFLINGRAVKPQDNRANYHKLIYRHHHRH